jgi:hypothetical protein
LYPAYEKVHALLAEIKLYLFDEHGALIESQLVRRGKVVVGVTEQELRTARIVVAPPLEESADQPLTLELARSQHVFETEVKFDPAATSYQLTPVPEAIWRWWLVHNLWKSIHGHPGNKSKLKLW